MKCPCCQLHTSPPDPPNFGRNAYTYKSLYIPSLSPSPTLPFPLTKNLGTPFFSISLPIPYLSIIKKTREQNVSTTWVAYNELYSQLGCLSMAYLKLLPSQSYQQSVLACLMGEQFILPSFATNGLLPSPRLSNVGSINFLNDHVNDQLQPIGTKLKGKKEKKRQHNYCRVIFIYQYIV